MKYIVSVLVVVVIVNSAVAGYLLLKPGTNPISNNTAKSQVASDEIVNLNFSLSKLQNVLSEMKDILAHQSVFIQKLKEDNIADSARITQLENKIQTLSSDSKLSADLPDLQKSAGPQTTIPELSYQKFSPELFKDPEFSKVFQAQVSQVIKDIEEQRRDTRDAQMEERRQQAITERISAFAKAQNLTGFQQEELTKIVSERANKERELFTQMNSQETTPEELTTKRAVIVNESNEKVKQVLTPQQYEEYQKTENQSRGRMGIGGNRRNTPGQGGVTPPSPR